MDLQFLSSKVQRFVSLYLVLAIKFRSIPLVALAICLLDFLQVQSSLMEVTAQFDENLFQADR